MNLQQRIDLLIRLGQYILNNDTEWQEVKQRVASQNNWFTAAFIDKASNTIAEEFLNAGKLTSFVKAYSLPEINMHAKTVGLVMAGNIPLVGFHDLLCIFLSGHYASIKASSKDEILVKHLATKLHQWNPATIQQIYFAGLLKGCDAYIATGSNNSARYFDFYFGKYPHIIRRNKTSVAILTGKESMSQLEALSDDVHLYFGLGCRNVTKLYVPHKYDFVPLLNAFRNYDYFNDHHKYKNNYDYQLAIHMINRKYYMTNGSILLSEDSSVFSPISQLNYEYYTNVEAIEEMLVSDENIQCITGNGHIPFGKTQLPSLTDFADGVDTLKFLLELR